MPAAPTVQVSPVHQAALSRLGRALHGFALHAARRYLLAQHDLPATFEEIEKIPALLHHWQGIALQFVAAVLTEQNRVGLPITALEHEMRVRAQERQRLYAAAATDAERETLRQLSDRVPIVPAEQQPKPAPRVALVN
jgi:hypothetical protein